MRFDPDRCRSLLFVPAGNERFLNSALKGAADVIQVDLEDAVPPERKEAARQEAADAIARIHAARRVGVVRVNGGTPLLPGDLEGVLRPGLAGLTVPKVACAEDLRAIDRAASDLERKRGMSAGEVRLIAQVESAEGLLNVREIARATPRLAAMGIGSEDLMADLGGVPDPEALHFPNVQTLIAARAAGVVPLGYAGSITVYGEPDTYRRWIRQARRLGFEGGFCIHPNQVAILNEEFRPGQEEVAAARGLIEAFEAHREAGRGAFAHEGKMVDAPVVARARRVVRRSAVLEGERAPE